ncbi:MAG: hypothetical protein V4760_01800 [Bdellovibrionota bacterium]
MRRRDTYWSLFHTPEKRQINDLRTDHVEAVFEAIPSKDQKDWVIWREGFRSWKPFADFPQLITSLRQIDAAPADKPAPPTKEEVEPKIRRIDDKIETIALEFADENEKAAREERFAKVWDLTIISPTQRIPAKTVNVSLHGMQVAEPLTQSLPRYFTVEIRGAGNIISVVCSAIRAFDMQPTTRLKIEVNDQSHAYNAAVLAK